MIEFGKWTRHHGGTVEHLIGYVVQVRLDHGNGTHDYHETSVLEPGDEALRSWVWTKGFSRVVEYCVLRPKGMSVLEAIACDLNAPIDQAASPKEPVSVERRSR